MLFFVGTATQLDITPPHIPRIGQGGGILLLRYSMICVVASPSQKLYMTNSTMLVLAAESSILDHASKERNFHFLSARFDPCCRREENNTRQHFLDWTIPGSMELLSCRRCRLYRAIMFMSNPKKLCSMCMTC